MPHLQFETTESLDAAQKETTVEWVTEYYAELMETGTEHVGVTIRDEAFLSLGRAANDEPVAVLNADIRSGRSFDQRRELATAVIETLSEHWGVPGRNMYVIYTEHEGEAFHLEEGALASWSDSYGLLRLVTGTTARFRAVGPELTRSSPYQRPRATARSEAPASTNPST